MALAALGHLAGGRKITAQNRVQNDYGNDVAEDPEAPGNRKLRENRHRRHEQDSESDSVRRNRYTAGHEQSGGTFDRSPFFILEALQFLEDPLAKLNRMADCASRNQKRHDQDQRLEVV